MTIAFENSFQDLNKVWFPLSQFLPRQQPILSQNKAISGKNDCSTT